MTIAAGRRLDELTRDPSTAPLARLLAVAVEAIDDLAWARAVPSMDPASLADGLPLLHGSTIELELAHAAALLDDLIASTGAPPPAHPASPAAHGVSPASPAGAGRPPRAQRGRTGGMKLPGWGDFAPALIEASVAQSTDRIAALADAADIDADVLAIIGHALSLPLLLACGKAAPATDGWDDGWCPVCAAWPTLVETRGLDRARWLRCARCGAGWQLPPLRCPHCGETDHRKLGYLAPAHDRESRRAETCDTCHSYVKSIAVLAASRPADLPALDLETLELDIAAIDRGYGRPAEPAFPLELRVLASER